MPKTDPHALALDTSVIVAAVLSWHEDHERSYASLTKALATGQEILLPARVLLEAYAVLTRLPAPHRLRPEDALAVLAGTLAGSSRLVDLPREQVWRFVRGLPGRGVAGGAVYDAEIVECARRAGAAAILTADRKGFERLAAGRVTIVAPGEPA